MDVARLDDPAAFLDLAGPFARRAEGRNQLVLGIAANAAAGRHGFSPFRGWVVVDGEPVAAAVWTTPRNPVIADPASDEALSTLIEAIVEDARDAPGVTGNVPAVDRFVEAWTSRTGETATVTLHQGVWELDHVKDVARPPGLAEPATLDEADLVTKWFIDFEAEAIPHHEPPAWADVHASIEERLTDEVSGAWVWRVDGEPVSIAGFSGTTGTGIRVGPVYSPPECRRRGYATALVAALSAYLLASGYQRCFLYTDLANPTANRIYATIGYRQVAESSMLAFDR
jgi:GNAT superfamily N-acetyltransferase